MNIETIDDLLKNLKHIKLKIIINNIYFNKFELKRILKYALKIRLTKIDDLDSIDKETLLEVSKKKPIEPPMDYNKHLENYLKNELK